MEGNQALSLKRSKSDRIQPSPHSAKDPMLFKKKLAANLAKEKKIKKSLAALNRSLSPTPSPISLRKQKLLAEKSPTKDKQARGKRGNDVDDNKDVSMKVLLGMGVSFEDAAFALEQCGNDLEVCTCIYVQIQSHNFKVPVFTFG